MNEKLTGCPICAGEADLFESEGAIGVQHFVACAPSDAFKGCVRQDKTYARKSEAIAAWNHRHSKFSVVKESITAEPVSDTYKLDNEKLTDLVDEYLHWRKVNPHIKGGENYLKRLREATPRRESGQWQPIETAPKNIKIIIYYTNSNGKGRTVFASYIAKNTVEADSESDVCEYNEEKDCYFMPEGWYEEIDNWDDYSSIAIYNSNKITHWMPLPNPPKIEGDS